MIKKINRKQKDNTKELYELYNENNNTDIKLCVKCHKYMDINTKHCISCDICIKDWDHHCFWLNTCISKNNYKYFTFFLIDIILCLLLNMTINVFFFLLMRHYPKLYKIFLLKEEDFTGDFDFITISILIFDCILFLISLIFLVSFILPFLYDLLCEENEDDNLLKKNNKESTLETKFIIKESI